MLRCNHTVYDVPSVIPSHPIPAWRPAAHRNAGRPGGRGEQARRAAARKAGGTHRRRGEQRAERGCGPKEAGGCTHRDLEPGRRIAAARPTDRPTDRPATHSAAAKGSPSAARAHQHHTVPPRRVHLPPAAAGGGLLVEAATRRVQYTTCPQEQARRHAKALASHRHAIAHHPRGRTDERAHHGAHGTGAHGTGAHVKPIHQTSKPHWLPFRSYAPHTAVSVKFTVESNSEPVNQKRRK